MTDCRWCSEPIPPRPSGQSGPQREFCSDSHKMAWHRSEALREQAQQPSVPTDMAGVLAYTQQPMTPKEIEAERPEMEAYAARVTKERQQPGYDPDGPISAADWPLEVRWRRYSAHVHPGAGATSR
jgi:hypothetical protein